MEGLGTCTFTRLHHELTRCSVLVGVDQRHADVVDGLAPPLLHEAGQALRYEVKFVRARTVV